MPPLKIPREIVPEQEAKVRARNFNEVSLGFSEEQAQREAKRCLQCKIPKCVPGCPVEIDIPAFIKKIEEKDYIGACKKIKEKNALPAVCGRVCPQEVQCEGGCVLGIKGQSVAIGALERFVAEEEAKLGEIFVPTIERNHRKVAVIGAGPAGITVASDLALLGYDVTVFEAFHCPGGVLTYGIPEFRLPKKVVFREIDYVKSLGVKFDLNAVIGKVATIPELMHEQNFEAVFVATGAGLPSFLDLPGESLIGISTSNEFLTRVNLMKAYKFPVYDTPVMVGQRVGVIGGGNTAMDSARTALRLGAQEVHLIYRRSEEEMPARKEEIHHAKQEGVQFNLLTNPIEFVGENGNLKAVRCVKMELGEPDASGRRKPVPKKGSEFNIPVDTFILAVGAGPNPLIPKTTDGLKIERDGRISIDYGTCATNVLGVFAGGDIATTKGTVIAAMGDAKRATRAIDNYLKQK